MRVYRPIILAMLLLSLLLPASALEQPAYALLGTYPSDALGNSAPILWKVLRDDGDGVLLLSELVLDVQPVQAEGRYNGFEYSTLKTWLQGTFAKAAFTTAELGIIALDEGAPLITLPSVEQLRKKDGGFFDAEGLRAAPSAYAKEQGVQTYRSGDASYWVSNRASSDPNGQRRVMDEGGFGYAIATYTNIGVRPLVLLMPGALSLAQGSGGLNQPYAFTLAEMEPTATPSEAPAPAETPAEEPAPAREAASEPAAEDTGAATEAPAGQPAAVLLAEGFPELTPQGFLPEGQAPYVFKDEENGIWRYASQTLRLVINRRQEVENKLRWFETSIFFAKGESLAMYPFDENNRRRMSPMEKIADLHNLVYAFNGDYYAYRVDRDRNADYVVTIGRVARNFKLLYDQKVSDNRKAHPNLDVMALYPDGRMTVHSANETTAQVLLDAGARDVLSFGPWLVRDGKINVNGVTNFGVTQQPRAGLGMVGEGHYLHIVVESRTSKSKGVNTAWLAEKFKELGCGTAFNLDGGQTAVLIFLGEQLNEIGKYDNKTNSRQQNEVMGIGTR